MKSLFVTSLSVVMALSLSACLKTRAQLRDESSDDTVHEQRAQAAQIQEVQPQGQYVIDELKSEITRLTGRIEDLERRAKARDAEGATAGKEDLKKLETRIIETENAQSEMIKAIQKMQQTMPAPEQPELFEKAQNEQKNGNHQAAVDDFTNYLRNPKAKHAEEATYLRGESYFALKEYKKAIMDFSKFPEKYSKSKRMPSALFRIGNSFEALGMKDDAKGFYQELAEKFPKSSEAKKAKAKLK
jgi:tol-pal system protein YbgF